MRIIPDMTNKQIAKAFLTDVTAGRIEPAYDQYVDMGGKHHNAYFAAGFPVLRRAMIENEVQLPNKAFEIQHIAEDGDIVMVHSKVRLSPEMPVMATVHIFRFKDGKIVEMWDLSQPEPEDMPNEDSMF
jgi:predicted SnoaL-like aldol condensation-catalyzing enzyme